jgi:hypothetical protein
MSVSPAGNFSNRRLARLAINHRPRLIDLEDRLSPGQTGFGSALALSLLGPTLAGIQLDALVAQVDASLVPPKAAVAPSVNWLANSVERAEAPVELPISSISTEAEGSTVGTTAQLSVAPAQAPARPASPALSQALDLGARSAQRAAQVAAAPPAVTDNRLAGNDGAITAPTPVGVNPGNIEPVMFRPPENSGTRNTIVGPNIQTNSSFVCSNGNGRIQSETAVAYSGNTIVVGYNDFRGFYCPGNGYQVLGWAYSVDRGRTFTDGGSLPGGTSLSGDPWLAVSPTGTFYMASLYNGLNNLAVLRGTPTGTGVSWSAPTILTGGASFDKEAIATDPVNGNIYVSYTRFSSQVSISLYRSTDGGVSFTGPVQISTGNVQGSMPVVGPNGEVYVAWQQNSGTFQSPTAIAFGRSTDGGQTFTVFNNIAPIGGFTVSGTDRAPAFPQIAVDRSGGPNNGNIYITYQSNHLGGGTSGDALIIRSTNGGTTWSAPTRINDDGTSALQWFPTVDVDSSGFVHSFFYDRRGQSGNNTNLYYARSADGGLSWEPNVRVSDTTFTMTTFGEGSPAWGDYINADTQGKSAMVAYTDGRNGNPDAFFTRVGNR